MHQHKFVFTFFVTLVLLLFPINSSQSDHCPNNTTSNSGPYIVGFPPWPDWCILRGPHFPYEICIVPFGPFGQPRFITGTERQETVQYNGLHSISTVYNRGSVGWRKPVLSLFPSICPPGSSVIPRRTTPTSDLQPCIAQILFEIYTNTFEKLHIHLSTREQCNTQAHTVPRYFHFCSFIDRPSGKYISTFGQIN